MYYYIINTCDPKDYCALRSARIGRGFRESRGFAGETTTTTTTIGGRGGVGGSEGVTGEVSDNNSLCPALRSARGEGLTRSRERARKTNGRAKGHAYTEKVSLLKQSHVPTPPFRRRCARRSYVVYKVLMIPETGVEKIITIARPSFAPL